jgi:hypothetical protein
MNGPIGDDCPKMRFTKHRPQLKVASMIADRARAWERKDELQERIWAFLRRAREWEKA